jgi:hypothetical protein
MFYHEFISIGKSLKKLTYLGYVTVLIDTLNTLMVYVSGNIHDSKQDVLPLA